MIAAPVSYTHLVLGLRLELRVDQLDGHDGRDALAHVLARQLVVFLEDVQLPARVVDDLGQRHFQPLDVRAAVDRVDVVGVAVNDLVIAFVVLDSDLAHRIAVRFLEIDGLGEQQLVAGLVELLDERTDTPFVAEGILLFLFGTLVLEGNAQPLIEVGQLPQTPLERVVTEYGGLENFVVGHKGHPRARLVRIPDHRHRPLRYAAVIYLLIDVPVLKNLGLQPFRQRVYGLDADAVQAARHLIARIAAEFAARVDFGEYDLERGNPLLRVDIGRNTAAVIRNGAAAVGIQHHFDVRAVARQRLVDGVVHHLVHEMVQPLGVRGRNIHTGPFSDVLQTVQYLDLFGAVLALNFFRHIFFTPDCTLF